MTFDELIGDIKKLEGLKLQSIKPGAELILKQVDMEKNRIILVAASGAERSRPFTEIQLIWDSLQSAVAIHVDEILHGSGTSRNQPETIFANLPYIEWFKYKNKKHISYIGKETHLIATLKEMNSMKRIEIQTKMENQYAQSRNHIVIVTKEIGDIVKYCEKICGVSAVAIQNGIYAIANTNISFNVVLYGALPFNLPIGTYVTIDQPADFVVNQQVDIGGNLFAIGDFEKANILFRHL